MNIYRVLKVTIIVAMSFMVTGNLFAKDCPCELKAEKAELEISMESIQKEYAMDPSSENLQKLTDTFARIEEINRKLEEVG